MMLKPAMKTLLEQVPSRYMLVKAVAAGELEIGEEV